MTLETIILGVTLVLVTVGYVLLKGRQVEIVSKVHDNPLYSSAKPVKVVFVSDLHLGFYFTIKSLKQRIEMINNLNPEVVVFGGDFVGWGFSFINKTKLMDAFRKIKCPHRLAIWGNHDGPYKEDLKNIFKQTNIQLLVNQQIVIEGLSFYGLDEAQYGQPKMPNLEGFNIVLLHQPEGLKYTSPSYQISGHSHGGQIVLPWLGRIHISSLSRQYWKGEYETPFGAIYVSRGLGYHVFPFRLGARPEITQITFSKKGLPYGL